MKDSKGNYIQFSDLFRSPDSIKQGDISLSHYFTDVKIIQDELEDLRLTSFSCWKISCTCDLIKVIRKYKHIEYVSYFLKGLNDS